MPSVFSLQPPGSKLFGDEGDSRQAQLTRTHEVLQTIGIHYQIGNKRLYYIHMRGAKLA